MNKAYGREVTDGHADVAYYSAYEKGRNEQTYQVGNQGQLAQYEAITRMVRRMALATVGVDQAIIVVSGQMICKSQHLI